MATGKRKLSQENRSFPLLRPVLALTVAVLAAFAAPALAEPTRIAPEDLFRDHQVSAEEAELRPIPRPPEIEVAALPNLRPISVVEVWEAAAALAHPVRAGVEQVNAEAARRAIENPPVSPISLALVLVLGALLLATLRQIMRMAGTANTTTYER